MGNNRPPQQMKKTIFLTIAMLFATISFAQQQLATLNHNDSITVYYGINALSQAHTEAVNGDIITLSSGIFNSPTITKAVTIRGAGAWVDSLGNQTALRTDIYIDVTNDSIYHLTLEGIYTFKTVIVRSAYNPRFIKCWFDGTVLCDQWSYIMRNAMFSNCRIKKWYNSNNNGWRAQNTQFVNSVIEESNSYSSPDSFINCVLQQSSDQDDMLNRLFQNCVLYGSKIYCPTENSTTSMNCIFIQTHNGCASLFSGHSGHTLWNMQGWNTVFKVDGFYELNDSIAVTCIGNDGTQVGIYGGILPFNPSVTNPVIRSINVGQRSTPDGKLPVDIEVVSEDE